MFICQIKNKPPLGVQVAAGDGLSLEQDFIEPFQEADLYIQPEEDSNAGRHDFEWQDFVLRIP